MKKIFFAMLALLCSFMLTVPVLADNSSTIVENNSSYTVKNSAFETAIENSVSAAEMEILMDKNNYDPSMSAVSFEGKPILTVYFWNCWDVCDQSLEDVVNDAKEFIPTMDYIVFGEEIQRITTFKRATDGRLIVGLQETYDKLPLYLEDIMNLESNIALCGQKCNVNNVVCFEDSDEVIVYYVTDSGVFVKYYKNCNTDALVLTYDDFKNYGKKYNEYISSYKYNYNEDGDPLYGNESSFASFASFIDMLPSNMEHDTKTNNSNYMKWITVGVSVTVLISVSVFIVVSHKKKSV